MKKTMAFFLFTWFLIAVPAAALGPPYSPRALVAGEGTEGLVNGPFYSALFRWPLGLALELEKNLLYVADEGNNCIRVINLGKENTVSTLAGNGKNGYLDGPVSTALFNHPRALVFLPNRRIVVNDNGNNRIRLVDLDKGSVSTLAGNGTPGNGDGEGSQAQLGGVWNMAYLPEDDSLYFTQPDSGSLRKVDLKNGGVTTVFLKDQRLPHPGALCVNDGKIYVADRDRPFLYSLTPKPPTPSSPSGTFEWTALGADKKITALTFCGDALYALQADGNSPVAQFLPNHRDLKLYDFTGEPLAQPAKDSLLSDALYNLPMAFIPNPSSPGQFYIAKPSMNNVSSFRDLLYDNLRSVRSQNTNHIIDFEYPAEKPPGVFRILVIGDSRAFHVWAPQGDPGDANRFLTYEKRLEWELNAEAALKNSPTRFEVLTQGRLSWDPLNIWPYYEVPGTAAKYDIDLVLFMLSPHYDVSPFYQRPLTDQEIPQEKDDPEYHLKPWAQRIHGGLPQKLFDLCQANKLVTIENNQIIFGDFRAMTRNPEIETCMVQMYSRPLKLLAGKLASQKTKEGAQVRLEMCLVPEFAFTPFADLNPFWEKILGEIGAPSLNFFPIFTAFRESFCPFSENGGYDHLDTNGHLLMSLLLLDQLQSHQLIPLAPQKTVNP